REAWFGGVGWGARLAFAGAPGRVFGCWAPCSRLDPGPRAVFGASPRWFAGGFVPAVAFGDPERAELFGAAALRCSRSVFDAAPAAAAALVRLGRVASATRCGPGAVGACCCASACGIAVLTRPRATFACALARGITAAAACGSARPA